MKRGKGEGSVYQRASDGRWVGKWYDRTGHPRYVYGADRQDTRRKLREKLDERDQGRVGGGTTVGAWCDRWLRSLAKAGAPENTVDDYTYRLSLLPGWVRGTRLDELEPLDVEGALHELLATHASSTVAKVRQVLGAALGQAHKYGKVARNAAKLADPIHVEEIEIVPLDPAEARALLASVSGHRLSSLYTVAIAVGVREGEAIGLRWDAVDLSAGTLTVTRQRTRTNRGKALDRKPKSGSGRTIALPDVCVQALLEHRKRQAGERLRLGPAWKDHGLVWPSEVGTPLGARNLLRHLHGSCERAGIRRVSFHALRHSAASFLLAQGVAETVIMDVLGHSSRAMLARYAHVTDGLRREAADAMDRVLGVGLGVSERGADAT